MHAVRCCPARHNSLLGSTKGPAHLLRGRPAPLQHLGAKCASLPKHVASLLGPSPEEQREFDTLWSEYARELELSKETSNAIAKQARQGYLVCDASFLRARTLKFLDVCGKVPGLNPRNVLSQSSLTLRYSPRILAATARRLLILLPDHDITSTLVTVMAHVDLGPDILASHLLELEYVLCPCFFGAAVPPLMFAFYMSEQLELEAQASPNDAPSSLGDGSGSNELDSLTKNSHGQAQHASINFAPASSRRTDTPSDRGQDGTEGSHGDDSMLSSNAGAVKNSVGWGKDSDRGARCSLSNAPQDQPRTEVDGVTEAMQQDLQQAGHPLSLDLGGAVGEDDSSIEDNDMHPGRQPLDLCEILVRVQALISILGTEVAYVGLSRTPRNMLGVSSQQAQATLTALQDVLRVDAASAARMVESRGKLAALDPADLQPQLSALTIALGWPKQRARLLCLEEPLALLRTPSSIGKLWRRLQRATQLHRGWTDALSQAPVEYLAMLIRLPMPDEALARLDFLSRAAGNTQQLKLPELERVLRTPIGAFLQNYPEYNSRFS